jgi:hypothetical protein
MDAIVAVEVPDRLPLARPAGCFIASRPSRNGDHERFSARRERLPSASGILPLAPGSQTIPRPGGSLDQQH